MVILNKEMRKSQLENIMRLLRETTRLYQSLEMESGDIFRGSGLYLEFMKLNGLINSVYKKLYPNGEMVRNE